MVEDPAGLSHTLESTPCSLRDNLFRERYTNTGGVTRCVMEAMGTYNVGEMETRDHFALYKLFSPCRLFPIKEDWGQSKQ